MAGNNTELSAYSGATSWLLGTRFLTGVATKKLWTKRNSVRAFPKGILQNPMES